ncbi:Alpha-ketoglutarate permease [Kluyvera cryocrescens]|uniref:Alpha-ketoglutarate permease n=1 Tax=Kluyvera cryocrescens TaxID=580 RepID=A0A485BZ47_KLUCR|nr:Alpha-ketoglutarate permease [Kluyvera cryocrescens]
MTIVGPWFSGFMIPRVGETTTLLSGFLFVLAGCGCALVLNRDKPHWQRDVAIGPALAEGIIVLLREPKMRLAVVVKTINDIGKFSLVILMPVYLPRFGFSIEEWLTIWGLVNVVNIFANYLFGWLGDTIGWRNTVAWFAGTLCGISALAVCYAPVLFGHSSTALDYRAGDLCHWPWGVWPTERADPFAAAGKQRSGDLLPEFRLRVKQLCRPAYRHAVRESAGRGGTLWVIALLYFAASLLTLPLKMPETAIGEKSSTLFSQAPFY